MNRKQKSVATSITEAKYMTLFTCAKKEMWLVQLLKDMKFSKYLDNENNQISVMKDIEHKSTVVQFKKNNQAANHLIKNVHIHKRFKYINIAYHHVRDLIKENLIQLNYVSNAEMMTDKLIKPLTRNKFKGFVNQLKLDA